MHLELLTLGIFSPIAWTTEPSGIISCVATFASHETAFVFHHTISLWIPSFSIVSIVLGNMEMAEGAAREGLLTMEFQSM